MEKRLIVKLLFALFLICIQTCTSEKKMRQANYLWQAQHWDEMTGFNKIKNVIINGITKRDLMKNELWTAPIVAEVYKFKIILLVMKCGYGKKIIDCLWTTMLTIIECSNLSNDGQHFHALDCWLKLEESLNKGARTMFKLSRIYIQISNFDKRIIDVHSFYGTILQIHDFLKEALPAMKNGLTAIDANNFYEEIKRFAASLELRWSDTCQPAHYTISQQDLLNEYGHLPLAEGEITYEFYLARLHSSFDFIINHTENIGFHYTTNRKNVKFSIPNKSSSSEEE